MESAPEWTAEVEESLADVIATVYAAGRNVKAQPFWRFLQQGGRLPSGNLLRTALAGPQVYEIPSKPSLLPTEPCVVRPAPDFAGAPPLQSVSITGGDGYDHLAALTVHGDVMCTVRPREGLVPVRLPWPAAAVSCADAFCVALRRGGGAVCQWHISIDGLAAVPEEVPGLPAGDPVVAVEAGFGVALALTASGIAYWWGRREYFRPDGAAAAVYITELRKYRIRRCRLGKSAVCAETEEGKLLHLLLTSQGTSDMRRVVWLDHADVTFPLRCMGPPQENEVAVVDAMGNVVVVRRKDDVFLPGFLHNYVPKCIAGAFDIPNPRCIALAENGEVWEARPEEGWHSISAARPELPRGLRPFDGPFCNNVILLPDSSCGMARLRLFARIAAKLELPSDPVRVELLRAALQSCYIVGPENDPFGWLSADAAAAAAAAWH